MRLLSCFLLSFYTSSHSIFYLLSTTSALKNPETCDTRTELTSTSCQVSRTSTLLDFRPSAHTPLLTFIMSPSTSAQKKRPAEEDLQGPAAKRPGARSQNDDEVVEVEGTDDFQVEATLNSKFDVFPAPLRAAIERSFASAARSQMLALSANTPSKHKFTYSVVTECFAPRSGNVPNTTIIKNGFLTLSQSNTCALTQMLRWSKDKLGKIGPKTKFARLERNGYVNPKFSHFHSVRHGEIGWGFDANGCLSINVEYIDKDEKWCYTIYVEKNVLKTEGKET